MNPTELPPLTLFEAMTQEAYWPQDRVVTEQAKEPPLSYEPTMDFILRTFHAAKNAQMVPRQLEDGERIPVIGKREGLVKFVLDDFTSEKIKFMPNFPTYFPGKTVQTPQEFNDAAQEMIDTTWYDGGGVRYKWRADADGYRVYNEVTRNVAYTISMGEGRGNWSGWNTGFQSRSMKRKPDSYRPVFNFFRGNDFEYFARRVGDVRVQKPNNLKSADQLTVYRKVTAAYVLRNAQ